MAEPIIVFDGDCAFCTSCVTWAARVIAPDVTWQPWQHSNLAELGLTQAQCEQALQWVDVAATAETRTPRHAGGGMAVRLILLQGRGVWPAIGTLLGLPGIRSVVDWAYRLVARNRHRLPGATPACALPTAPVRRVTNGPTVQ